MRSSLAFSLTLSLAIAAIAPKTLAQDAGEPDAMNPIADAGAGEDAPSEDGAVPVRPEQPRPNVEADAETHLRADQRKDPASYRGRTNYGTADEALSWIPRVVFFPFYLVSEFVLRRPVVALADFIDRHHIVPILNDIFNPTPDIYWSPTLLLDLGNFVAVGVEGRWRNFLVRGHEISGSAETGGLDGWRLRLRDAWHVGPATLGARGTYYTRQDRTFYGLGPDSKESDLTYYSETYAEALAFTSIDYRNNFHAELSGGFRDEITGSGYQPSINGRFYPDVIPGLNQELGLVVGMLDLRADSRLVADQSGGFRVLANATLAHDVHDAERTFVRGTIDAEGAIEVSKPDRLLTLRGYLVDSAPLGKEPVPFTELAMLGWANHFGFRWGRFRDESAVMAEVRYRYPIAYFIDAQWIASVGNVFSRTFEDFAPQKLTTSLGFGLRTRRTGRTPLELVIALGTTRFDEPFAIQSVRVYLSTTEGL